jgi:4-amino-4-deoxy-L-arabinose transferase-like glycosyltransferase
MILKPENIGFRQFWYIIFLFALAVYAVGIPVTLMEPDATVYADISMEMLMRNNLLEIFLKGEDWLDKPHFQFWVTALSYKIFGINNFGYKFPAILFSLLAVCYTFLFGRRFYSATHGAIAAILLMTAQHFILSNNDVRAEPYLTGLTIFSLYYFARYLEHKKFRRLFLGSLGLACLLMTKGLFTILPVASALGMTLILEKRWKEILNVQWIWVIGLTLVMILPSLTGYFIQFDLHPEKVIFGRTHVSGIKFFLWDSQWGRFTNTGPIRGQGDPFFYLHTMLWAFAPWAFLFLYSTFVRFRDLLRRDKQHEYYTLTGFIFVFFIFSVSSFQLPHYLNQVFPLMAILSTAGLLRKNKANHTLPVLLILQIVTVTMFGIATILLHYYFSGMYPRMDVMVILVLGWSLTVYLFFREGSWIKRIILPPAIFILSINYYLNRQFYPDLLPYQSESEVAFYLREKNIPADKLLIYQKRAWATDFYLRQIIPEQERIDPGNAHLRERYVFTSSEGLENLRENGFKTEPIQSFPDFHVTTLTGEFINRKTRSGVLQTNWLVRIR